MVISTVEINDPGEGEEVYANPVIEWDEITGLLKYELEMDTTYAWSPSNTGTGEDINATFIIDEKGVIKEIFEKVQTKDHTNQIIKALNI